MTFILAINYSTLAPLISPFALFFFAVNYLVSVNQMMYVYNPPYHTGGSQVSSRNRKRRKRKRREEEEEEEEEEEAFS